MGVARALMRAAHQILKLLERFPLGDVVAVAVTLPARLRTVGLPVLRRSCYRHSKKPSATQWLHSAMVGVVFSNLVQGRSV